MKAKEKAEELVRKYYTFGINKEGQTLSWYECKQCALIAVDEILNEENHFIQTDAHFLYWEQVKEEIENL
jgi:capsule polysaccharide export protein KpsC/LpsZ